MRMYYRVDISEEELEQNSVDLINWAFEHMVKEFNRNAPHGPIIMKRDYNYRTRMHIAMIEAEWKEPVQ